VRAPPLSWGVGLGAEWEILQTNQGSGWIQLRKGWGLHKKEGTEYTILGWAPTVYQAVFYVTAITPSK
jgi:hypothetical protein